MINRRALLTAAQVADYLGITLARFRRARRALRAAGFPEPLPGLGNLWSPTQIDAWLDHPAPTPRPEPADVPAAAITNWQAELDRRSSRITA